jgi:glycosyltransferase involved in cell wall biosynthesis
MIMDGSFGIKDDVIVSLHMHYDAFGYRFVDYFSSVNICARVFQNKNEGFPVSNNDNLKFIPVPSYRGALDFLKKIPNIYRILLDVINKSDILLLRFPGNLSIIALMLCILKRKKFSIEIVAEPRDYFSKSSSSSKLRHVAYFAHVTSIKIALFFARSVRYVTKDFLQKRYPPLKNSICFGFSDVNLFKPKKIDKPEIKFYDDNVFTFVNVAMMHNYSKGHFVLIDAFDRLILMGVKCRLLLVGDGLLRDEFQSYAETKKSHHSIFFLGSLTSSEVENVLLVSDAFVLSSYQEGMPRSLLEAVGLGLPAVSSNVGGIYEVLPNECLFPPGDHLALFSLMYKLSNSEDFAIKTKSILMNSIDDFRPDVIDLKYAEYFSRLKEVS